MKQPHIWRPVRIALALTYAMALVVVYCDMWVWGPEPLPGCSTAVEKSCGLPAHTLKHKGK